MNQLLTSAIIFLFFLVLPGEAKNSGKTERLENAPVITKVRNSIISKGIAACKAEKYQKTIQLLSSFLNPRKVVLSAWEIEGLNCLALAYQKVGEPTRARKTILRAISIIEGSISQQQGKPNAFESSAINSLQLADLEYTAGIIAYQQNQKAIANQHWQKARQLYLTHKFTKDWAKTTLNLVKNYQELGNIQKSQQLLEELKQETQN